MAAESGSTVAAKALELARINEKGLEAHEELCAERYKNIHEKIGEIKKWLTWAGTTGFTIIIALLAFMGKQLYDSNAEARAAMQTRLQVIEQQANQQPKGGL